LLVDVSQGLTIAFTVWSPEGCTGGIMKRILLVLMSVFMLAFLVGCGNDASKPAETGKPSTSEKLLPVLKGLLQNWLMLTKKAII